MSVAESNQAPAASKLCASCGLCCNGVLFFGVKLQAAESAKAFISKGLRIKRKDSTLYCLQPCTAHQNGACSIYRDRPVRCREFECKQLLAVQNAELTETAALDHIQHAHLLADHVRELFLQAGEERTGKAFSQRYAAVFTPPLDPDPKAALIREQLRTAMQQLEDFLTLHFRTSTAFDAKKTDRMEGRFLVPSPADQKAGE